MFERMLDQSVSEHRPERCPNGHVYVDSAGSRVKIGWEPCLCTTGHTGHRTVYCQQIERRLLDLARLHRPAGLA